MEQSLHANTIDFLTGRNISRVIQLGGRPKRGLLLSGAPGNGKKGDTISKIIMEKILVRKVEKSKANPEDKPQTSESISITLEVTPEQEKILSEAVKTGSISLSLRPFADEVKKEGKETPSLPK